MIIYRNGDLLKSGCDVICHQVNCQGVMGSGIAKAIRDKYPRVYQQFIHRHQHQGSKLGDVDVFSQKDGDRKFYIVNLYSQDEYLPRGVCHTNYNAFRECLNKLKDEITLSEKYGRQNLKPKIGFPDHIGCGLAGGDWNIVKKIIEEEFAGDEWEIEIWKLS